ncbi:glyoxalase superfamily protein [Pokkaliibacter sp. MBI-7]|uniref:glyoxalase superfamily protein n=1 Tax=Pokkaliibacter sp. MBI-7 TaxID=3040600 RepID=UPI00244BC0DF|nr:glyoxalase superfamily protein [Pokkaliibacter sp. MBI-7]MDH2436050.1 glyoxalase superfamily protein [Pokkaliibacter sp. MBI-7]
MSLSGAIPILRIFDEARAREFYLDFLGFHLDWEHRFDRDFPLYLQISLDQCVLHLTEHHGDCCPGSAIRIPCDHLHQYCEQLNTRNYAYAHPGIKKMPWGTSDMAIIDPFGNRLVFTRDDEVC